MKRRRPECERLLDYEQLHDGTFVVTNPCGLDFGWFRVPYGFVSDGDTMPDWVRSWWDTDALRVIRLPYAIGHDYLYKTRKVPRRIADRWLRESVIYDRFSPWRAWTEWFWIRLCGWWFWYFAVDAVDVIDDHYVGKKRIDPRVTPQPRCDVRPPVDFCRGFWYNCGQEGARRHLWK